VDINLKKRMENQIDLFINNNPHVPDNNKYSLLLVLPRLFTSVNIIKTVKLLPQK